MEKNITSKSWQELLALCQSKFRYEKENALYDTLPFFRKLFSRRPSEPAKGVSSDSIATLYVQAFNRTHKMNGNPFGRRSLIGDAYRNDSVHITLRFQSEDRLPVLTATYYEDGTAYIESVKFLPGGGTQVQPIRYPYSEIGIYGIPERPKVKEVGFLKKAFKDASSEIIKVMEELG